MRQRLAQESPERVHELHRRAALTQPDPFRAVHHYLAAAMWDEAAAMIERIGQQAIERGLLTTLTSWIAALPADAHAAHPGLTYLQGVCAWQRGDPLAAQALLQDALRRFEETGDQEGQLEALVHLPPGLSMGANFTAAQEVAGRVLALPASPSQRIQAHMVRGVAALSADDGQSATAHLQAASAVADAAGDPALWGLQLVHCINPFVTVPGGLDQMERLCRRLVGPAGDALSVGGMAIHARQACVHLLRGRADEARRSGERALAIGERLGGIPYLAGEAALALGQAQLALGDPMKASQALASATAAFRQFPHGRAAIALTLYPQGLARWQGGDIDSLRQVYAEMQAASLPGELPLAPALRSMLAGVIALAERSYTEAERVLRAAAALQARSPTSVLAGSARLLLAHLYSAWGRPEEALAELWPILTECERADTPGRMLQEGLYVWPLLHLAATRAPHTAWIARLLNMADASKRARPARIPGTGETLTPREVEILRLLAAGASNQAIAGQLSTTEGTVKSHLHHIFRKLDVTSRTEAAARARGLRLV